MAGEKVVQKRVTRNSARKDPPTKTKETRSRSRKPVQKSKRKPLEKPVNSDSETEELTAEQENPGKTMKETIAHEVNQILSDVMPAILEEAVEKLKEGRKEKVSKRRVVRDEEKYDDDGSDDSESEEISKGCNYGVFSRCKPPTFDGNGDVAAAQRWIREMNAVLNISECREDQKVKFAAHSLVDTALVWWDNIVVANGTRAIARMTWSEMRRLVAEEYCPERELDKMEREFLSLEAGNMTHQEYTSKFNEMARLVPELVTPESKRIKRYIQGLPLDIRRNMVTAKPGTFRSAVDLSGRLYDHRGPVAVGGQKNIGNGDNLWDDDHQMVVKKARVDAKQLVAQGFDEQEGCGKCGRKHRGECRAGQDGCYRCGKGGHISSNCPEMKRCFNCGEKGHKAQDCKKPKGKDIM